MREGLLVGDRYQMISLHENLLFSYFETPRDREQVNISRRPEPSEATKEWEAVVPESHFYHFPEANGENFSDHFDCFFCGIKVYSKNRLYYTVPIKKKEDCMMQKLELYIHIPFCVQKCAYCDFLSAPANDAAKAEYVDALKKEIQRYREVASSYQVSSVFVGGGTPSILSCEQMGEIFKMLRQVFTIDRDAEITIEANPGTVTEEKLEGWKQAGINRISFGLQSVNNEELKMLGRIHTYEEFRESYDMARQADLIISTLISSQPFPDRP